MPHRTPLPSRRDLARRSSRRPTSSGSKARAKLRLQQPQATTGAATYGGSSLLRRCAESAWPNFARANSIRPPATWLIQVAGIALPHAKRANRKCGRADGERLRSRLDRGKRIARRLRPTPGQPSAPGTAEAPGLALPARLQQKGKDDHADGSDRCRRGWRRVRGGPGEGGLM